MVGRLAAHVVTALMTLHVAAPAALVSRALSRWGHALDYSGDEFFAADGKPSWQAFKQGISEVVSDRLVLIDLREKVGAKEATLGDRPD